jgi:SAM-dependent methyltransferase
MRGKYGDRPNFNLVNGDFELYPFANESFDFVYSAAAIQWIEPTVAFSKCFDILKPGGHLAMFFLRSDYKTPNPALYADIQKVYDEHYHTEAPYKQRFPYADAPKYGFIDMEEHSFPSSRRYTADEYVEYIHTHSDHIMLREECKAAFYGGIRDAILRHGDKIEFRDEFALHLCRKPTPTTARQP